MAENWDEFDKAPAADPWGEFEQAKPAPKPGPTTGEAFQRHAVEGLYLGTYPRAAGLAQNVGARQEARMAKAFPQSPLDPEYPTPGRLAKWYPNLDPLQRDAQYKQDWLSKHGFKDWDEYSQALNRAELDPAAAQKGDALRRSIVEGDREAFKAHPLASIAGGVVGGAPLMVLGGGGGAPGLLGKMAAGARTGAGMGALAGWGSSDADSAAGTAGNVVLSSGLGAGVGSLLPAVGAGAKRLLEPIADSLRHRSIALGRNAIAGVMNSLARRKPLSEAAVDAAFDTGAIKFGSNVEGIANRLQGATDVVGERYSQILKDLAAKGVTGPNAEALAKRLAAGSEDAFQNSLIGTRADALKSAGQALLARKPAAGQDLGLMQAELMKRELQQAAASDFVKEGATSLSGDARKELAGIMREEVENAVSQQAAKAPEEAAAFQPTKEQLHRLLEGLGAAREGAARYARRTPFGLHEAMGLATGIATGNPVEAAGSAGLMHALKDRGASSGAVMARALEKALRRGATAAEGAQRSAPAQMDYVTALADSLARRLGLSPAYADQEAGQ